MYYRPLIKADQLSAAQPPRLRQTLQARFERFTPFREAEADDVGGRIGVVEGGERDGAYAGFPNGALAKGKIVHRDAGGGEIDTEEIGALRRQRDEARVAEAHGEEIPPFREPIAHRVEMARI